jgi:3D (Asp-Asp-Asp) domain-containing protein/peptidoglycan hydrolase CwlO-like protein
MRQKWRKMGRMAWPPGGQRCGTVERHVRARCHKLPRFLAVLVGLLLVLGAPATLPAQGPGVAGLRQKQAALAAESRAAVVQLYGLESRLAQARSDLARVQARADALSREQASVRLRVRAAKRTTTVAEQRLSAQLRYLYEQGEPDPIAVVLGATSLQDAIDGLDAVHRTARATQSVVDGARAARSRLATVQRELTRQVARTNEVRSSLAETASGLEQAQAERTAYLAGLRREQQLTAAQISRVEAQAQEARQRAQVVTRAATARPATGTAPVKTSDQSTPPAASAPSEPPPAPVDSVASAPPAAPTAAPPPPKPGGTMTVYATGYCLKGSTATGLPVGPGIVATDPSVIPLGTRMTIPGYGEGVAADTGGAVQGARIDVWFKSCADAAAFGRTVTITFH